MHTQFESFISDPENRRIYEQERLLVDTTELLATVMESTRTRRSDLAHRLGRSKSYITQILRANQNLTLKTIADVFFALNYRLVVVAEPIRAGMGLLLPRQWNMTQRAGNAEVTDEYNPSDDFLGEMAA